MKIIRSKNSDTKSSELKDLSELVDWIKKNKEMIPKYLEVHTTFAGTSSDPKSVNNLIEELEEKQENIKRVSDIVDSVKSGKSFKAKNIYELLDVAEKIGCHTINHGNGYELYIGPEFKSTYMNFISELNDTNKKLVRNRCYANFYAASDEVKSLVPELKNSTLITPRERALVVSSITDPKLREDIINKFADDNFMTKEFVDENVSKIEPYVTEALSQFKVTNSRNSRRFRNSYSDDYILWMRFTDNGGITTEVTRANECPENNGSFNNPFLPVNALLTIRDAYYLEDSANSIPYTKYGWTEILSKLNKDARNLGAPELRELPTSYYLDWGASHMYGNFNGWTAGEINYLRSLRLDD